MDTTEGMDPTDVLFVKVTWEQRTIAEVLMPLLRIDGASNINWLSKPKSARAAILACMFAARAMTIKKRRPQSEVKLDELYRWLEPMQWAESSIRVNAGQLVDDGYIARDGRGTFRLVYKRLEASVRLIKFFTP